MEQRKYSLPPLIEYEKHPGFQQLNVQSSNTFNIEKLKQIIANIDFNLHQLNSKHFLDEQELNSFFDSAIAKKINELRKETVECIQDSKVREWLNRSFDSTLTVLKSEITYFNNTHAYKTNLSEENKKHLVNMDINGFSLFEFSKETKQLLLEGAKPFCDQLKEMARVTPKDRLSISVPLYGKYGKAIRKICIDGGVLEVASSFRKHEMEIDYAALCYSFAGQDWFKNCYSDVGLPTAKTVTMHYDYETTMLKGIIYLSNVKNVDEGAFRIVKGSNRWDKSMFLFTFYKDLDEQYREVFLTKQKLDGMYYRYRFRTAEDRERQLQLPEIFRGTSHFGDDVLDNTELSEYLLKNEFSLLGNEPVCLLFDGPNAIHRGGFTYEGERWAIQLGFRLKKEVSPLKRFYLNTRRIAGRLKRFQTPF